MSSQTEKTQDNETKKVGNKDSRLWESIKFGFTILPSKSVRNFKTL